MWGSSAAWSYGSGGSSCAIRPPEERIVVSARTGRSYFVMVSLGSLLANNGSVSSLEMTPLALMPVKNHGPLLDEDVVDAIVIQRRRREPSEGLVVLQNVLRAGDVNRTGEPYPPASNLLQPFGIRSCFQFDHRVGRAIGKDQNR